jgi:hypothetical protein
VKYGRQATARHRPAGQQAEQTSSRAAIHYITSGPLNSSQTGGPCLLPVAQLGHLGQ